MRDELWKVFNEYAEKFDRDYPMFMYNDTTEQAVERMRKCIEAGKPVEELYPVTVDGDTVI